MFMEVDEEMEAMLPDPIVDDDGDVLTVAEIGWVSDNPVVEVIPIGNGMTATIRATGVVGEAVVAATVTTVDGTSGVYTGSIAIGLGIPKGGELSFSTPHKIVP